MDDCFDCIEAVARLHLYIDRELNSEEVVVVQQHLLTCKDCDCRFHFDMSVKRLIHERCTVERAPEYLREQVLAFVRSSWSTAPIDPEFEAEMRKELEER